MAYMTGGDYDDREPLPERGRARRDVIGLALLIVGALLTTIGTAALWHPAAALVVAGLWLVAAGWLTATSR
ncbi:hypothetical protein ETD86_45055 [Nonomuraea turkmeniaca]|uniref:Uncharacterized protein n=1 Tax=Nonomuraea turkmeniaca TaxID=103838 RepID=A0A5S4EZA7_9ACTN|nr:hypothetical protein [Nonomuraea turkmeniaca]TMR09084.1 hypothetical protein ETD86_45055 [Nonomuraea turkmeniaca]